jgi:uncharacterized protein YecE (DUF72 family)
MQWQVGTSGWSYKRWIGEFYPADIPANTYLSYYAGYFSSVEVNTSFYHLPRADQFVKWEKAVPEDFIFCVKGSSYITHTKKLKDAAQSLPPLMEVLSIQKKRGPVLFQLPPRFHKNMERLEQFLAALPRKRRYTMEFRDPTWHDEEVYRLLSKHRIAFCLFEKGPLRSPRLSTTDFIYVRLHGRKENYKGNYSRTALAGWKKWLGDQGKDIYIYFDNTDEKMFAIENALSFQQMVKSP